MTDIYDAEPLFSDKVKGTYAHKDELEIGKIRAKEKSDQSKTVHN